MGKREAQSLLYWSISIVIKIGKNAYGLDLPVSLALIHPIFYVSMLTKCVGDPSLIVFVEDVGVIDYLFMKRYQLRYWICNLYIEGKGCSFSESHLEKSKGGRSYIGS